MNTVYLWQNDRFPRFEWDADALLLPLGEVHTLQGQLLGRMSALGFEGLAQQVEAVTQEIIGSSQIEGVTLNADSVRSSVARHLGLETAGNERHTSICGSTYCGTDVWMACRFLPDRL